MKQSGNALIFILIAIALLGLLTVTLSRSSDSTNDTGDFEQNQIAASEILSYAKSIENAVQMLLVRGCSENELSFWHDSDGNGTEDGSDNYYNDESPTDRSCHVFDVAGAGMTYETPNEEWLDRLESAQTGYAELFFSMQSNVDGNKVLAMIFPYVTKNICLQINTASNVVNTGGAPPKDNNTAYNYNDAAHRFTGRPPATGSYNSINPSSGELDAKFTGCFEGDTFPPGGFHVYHSLSIR